jgi:autoinducer 2 (AI-2) kinase
MEKTFFPDKENREIYEKAFGKWKAAYAPQLQLCDEKTTKYMWIAPGM